MTQGVHPRNNNGSYCVPSRVPEETIRTELENREYKVHPSSQDYLETLKRIEEQEKCQDNMAQQPIDASGSTKVILQSPLFTRDKSLLNDIALGRARELSKGERSFEVLKIQEALDNFGFDLGQSGVDGDFGSTTESAIKKFQQAYEPTHTTHATYQFGEVDGVVDKNTILALDEAVNENWKYVDDRITCDPKHFFYSEILAHEGGWIDHPNDPGGATNKGVILRTWNDYSRKLFGIEPSVKSLKEITDEQAYQIFLEGYWKKSLANEINNCPIAFQFVDFYYNAPEGSAVVLQRTINALGGNVVEDWAMGPSTLRALNEIISEGKIEDIYITFRNKRIEYYNHRADTVEGASVFRKGWVSRAEKFRDY